MLIFDMEWNKTGVILSHHRVYEYRKDIQNNLVCQIGSFPSKEAALGGKNPVSSFGIVFNNEANPFDFSKLKEKGNTIESIVEKWALENHETIKQFIDTAKYEE